MVKKTEKKTEAKGGGKLNRTHMVTIRLDPKLRYLTDLAARSQHRTTSGFIEWAINNSLRDVGIYSESDNEPSLADIGNYLWDVDESDRFLKLAIGFPALLTHDEQVMWKLATRYIIGNQGSYEKLSSDEKEIIYENWGLLKAAASGEAEAIEFVKNIIHSL